MNNRHFTRFALGAMAMREGIARHYEDEAKRLDLEISRAAYSDKETIKDRRDALLLIADKVRSIRVPSVAEQD